MKKSDTNIGTVIKTLVSCAVKSCEFIEVLLSDSIMVVNAADTTLSIIPVGFPSGIDLAFSYDDLIDNNLDLSNISDNHIIRRKLLNLWNMYETWSKTLPLSKEVKDLRADPLYEELISRKTSEGFAFYKINGDNLYEYYLLPVFSGFPPLNKGDIIGVKFKRLNNEVIIVEYHIYKKKLRNTFIMYFRTIDLTRKLKGYGKQ